VSHGLLTAFRQDFDASPARIALCGTGRPWLARVYRRHGFLPINDDADAGQLCLLKPDEGSNFREFEQRWFRPGPACRVVPGTMAERHDVDKLLAAALLLRGCEPRPVAADPRVTSYRDACFLAEDGEGHVYAVRTGGGVIVGWGFGRITGPDEERRAAEIHYELHPAFTRVRLAGAKQATAG
jgi:hypothetical protein